MRIVHTADWHLGKTLYGKDRTEEEVFALSYLRDFIKENNVELLLIAGDIFDKFIPSARAETTLLNFLAEIHHIGTQVVMIAGNHDSGIKLSSVSQVLKILKVYSFGKTGKDTWVKLINKDNEEVFIAALPFIREAEVLEIGDYDLPEHVVKSRYAERMRRVFEWFEKKFLDNGINIAISHILVDGSSASGTEHKFYLANSYAIPPLFLPHTASYIALGHIHKYQKIDTPSPTYYSGSLFPLDFGEDEKKGFIFLEIKPGFPPETLEFIEVPHKRLKVAKVGKKEVDNFIETHIQFDGYIKVILDIEGEDARIAMDKIKKRLPQVLSIQLPKRETQRKTRLDMEDILDPVKSYISYYKEKRGEEPGEELIETFKELYGKVTEIED